MGLVIITILAVYLIVSIVLVWWAVSAARKRNIKGWKWGAPAALFMYLIVFWDHIPTVITHKYYCERDAGFWVYKKPDQWISENPDIMQSLINYQPPQSIELERGWSGYLYNKRIRYEVRRTNNFSHAINKSEKLLRDTHTGYILARKVDYFIGSGRASFVSGGSVNGWRKALVFGWHGRGQCGPPADSPSEPFSKISREYLKHGEVK